MSEIDSPVIAVRKMLLLLVDCIASGGTSETFGETTPYLDYLTELRCMWFDDFYHGSEPLISDGVFEREEAEILDQFSVAFRRAYPKKSTPNEINIYKLQNDPVWQTVVSAAKDAQSKLRQLKS